MRARPARLLAAFLLSLRAPSYRRMQWRRLRAAVARDGFMRVAWRILAGQRAP